MHKIVRSHTNCSGGKTPGTSVALKHIAEEAVKDNPDILGIGLKRKIERDSELKVHHRTATRMKNVAKEASRTAEAGSYKHLPSLCAQLRADCPGTVAEVEVSISVFNPFSFRYIYSSSSIGPLIRNRGVGSMLTV